MALNNLTAMMFVVNTALKLILARAFHVIDNQDHYLFWRLERSRWSADAARGLSQEELLYAFCRKFLGGRTEYGRPAIIRLVCELDLIAFQDGGVIHNKFISVARRHLEFYF